MSESVPHRNGARYLRGLAAAVGALIMIASGLCAAGITVVTFVQMFVDYSGLSLWERLTVVAMTAAACGIPFLIGWALWRLAHRKKY